MANRSPIERTLDLVHDQWTAFAQNTQARLLRWLAVADEVAILDTFVARESEPEACETPDLFLRFDEAFELPEAYGFVLREAFVRRYEEARAELSQEGLDASFNAPLAHASDDDVRAFVRLLDAYHAHQQGQVALTAAYLRPESVRDVAAYQLWLQRLAREAPPHIRVAIIDRVEAPELEALADAEAVLVVSVPCDLDVPQALEDQSRDAGVDSDGARFRHLFVRLSKASKTADLAVAVPLAVAATQLATTLSWPHLAAVVQVMLGGMHSSASQPLDALRCYAEVDRLGHEVYARGESKVAPPEGAAELEGEAAMLLGLRLRRDARFGQGAVLTGQKAWEQAARVFLEAAPMSSALGDARGELDAFRLACASYEYAGRLSEAWHCGMKGLAVGASMDVDTRKTSTLAHLGEGMLRIAEAGEYAAHRDPVEQHMLTLLGPGWRPSPQGTH